MTEAEALRRELEIARLQGTQARVRFEHLAHLVARIVNLLPPPDMEVGGKRYSFKDPEAAAKLIRMRDAIEQIRADSEPALVELGKIHQDLERVGMGVARFLPSGLEHVPLEKVVFRV